MTRYCKFRSNLTFLLPVIPANNDFTDMLLHFIKTEEYCNISFIKCAYRELYQFLKDYLVVHTALLSRDSFVCPPESRLKY